MLGIPLWVILVLGGIAISAFMAVKTGREDRAVENEIIEREGEVYMKRLEEEKKRKNGEERVYEH
ncbi:sporulation YhaL family protein [Niallia sp. FSL W8-0635]|uniref:sporulation YhaL family protein n=1 Tax=Niallia sp. FSL W8-0635 TaxID=2975337 RepID=UPI0009D5A5DC|nr:Sporulation protein yhaL [Mycobacteroides abscessus subsp. abscessus]HEO8421493.1 sporulation YhaL family protein [Yersinia enterocolitica]